LRIDVDNPEGENFYGIPQDNPFFGNMSGFKEEIYAYGLRNPWRISFDSVTGQLWCGDVGQSSREEINIIQNGLNYGWPIMEGNLCFDPPEGCDPTGLELPLLGYGRAQGGTVIGGIVYYGDELPSLFGLYIYADFFVGRVWALEFDGVNFVDNTRLVQFNPFSIVAFGTDEQGEIYLASFDGKIYGLERIEN
jgi:glucose/arabinose dehydrogenase